MYGHATCPDDFDRDGVPLHREGLRHAARPAVAGPLILIRPRSGGSCRDQQRWSKAERRSALHIPVPPAMVSGMQFRRGASRSALMPTPHAIARGGRFPKRPYFSSILIERVVAFRPARGGIRLAAIFKRGNPRVSRLNGRRTYPAIGESPWPASLSDACRMTPV